MPVIHRNDDTITLYDVATGDYPTFPVSGILNQSLVTVISGAGDAANLDGNWTIFKDGAENGL